MKKIIALFSVFFISLVAFAALQNTKTSSCKIEGIPGAYITADASFPAQGGVKVELRSYGVAEAGVTVEITLKKTNGNVYKREKMGYIERGKGSVFFDVLSGTSDILSVKVYNAVCR